MKKLSFCLMILAVFLFSNLCFAEESSREGEITLERYEFGKDESKKSLIKLGTDVKFEVNAYISEFFDDTIINANAKIVNTTGANIMAIYVITFYDHNDKIIGAHAANWVIAPGDDVNYGSTLIKGREEDFKRVTKYKSYALAYATIAEPL